ncbi:MAG TPA: putative DNA-binding domain-containing protein [Candidatus Obscuribacterales bacterium]
MKQSARKSRTAVHGRGMAKLISFDEAERLFASAIMRPMTSGQRMQRKWIDGRSMREVAAEFIKPNDRLTSYERLEIYNKQYWFRLVDCMYEDFPGLLTVLGQKKFDALITEYLTRYPSSSFTLRNLGWRLVEFIEAEPEWTAPRQKMALDMARIEWAWVVAFDGEAKTPITADDVRSRDPERLRLSLQPYISLLELDYPLDDFLISLKKVEHLRTEASATCSHEVCVPKVPLPSPEHVYVAVHRFENWVYYKRLEPEEFAVLKGLQSGLTVAEACSLALNGSPDESEDLSDLARKISDWFATWSELGWLVLPDGS